MPILVQFEFSFAGPFGSDLAVAAKDMAESIAAEPGLIWKIWTESQATMEAGGVYLFDDPSAASAYIRKHTARLGQFGVSEARVKTFDVNVALSRITRGPIA
jgi:hypothetical protein